LLESNAQAVTQTPNQSSSPDAQAANVATESAHFQSGASEIQAYLAKPKDELKHPGVILVHDNRGLNEYIEDMARRFAGAGFVAMAPDLLSRARGTSKMTTPEAATAAINQLPSNATVGDLKAGYDFLEKYPGVDAASISSVGFGWGGWRSFMLATAAPTLHRSVMFCGSTPIAGLENIHAPVMAHYAQFDYRTTGNALPTQKEMTELGKKFTYYLYPSVGHAFFDDTAPQYNAAAAQLAWKRTLEFLKASG
jgi:carboxymethylenebutenolidase